jgi:phage FluMu gp28-like protein
MSLSSYFLPYQIRYLNDHSRFKIVEKSRRIGGTYMQSYEDCEDVVIKRQYTPGRPVEKVYFSSKDEDAGKEYIDYCAYWLKAFNAAASSPYDEVVDEKEGVTARVIKLKSGQKIHALTSAPTAFNSKGGKIVWDEAALHKGQQAMWSGAQPAALWGYPIRILSTHKGKKTLFYQFVQDTIRGKTGWSLHKIPIQLAVAEGLVDKIYGRPTTEEERASWLEETRRNCRLEEIWQEDYCCNPQDSTTAFFPYELLTSVEKPDILVPFENLQTLPGDLFVGWDVARKKDLSVVYVIQRIAFLRIVRFIKRFENTRFSIQNAFLDKVMQIPKVRRACIDQTGMGLPLTERAQELHGTYRIEGVTMTNACKEQLAIDSKNCIEDHFALLPDDEIVRESFHSIQKEVTAAGNTRFDAERTDSTGHADDFWAFALAIHAVSGGAGTPWAHSMNAGADLSAGYNGFTGENYQNLLNSY